MKVQRCAPVLAAALARKGCDQIKGGQGADAALDIIVSVGKGQMPMGFPVPGASSYRNARQETTQACNEPGRVVAFIDSA